MYEKELQAMIVAAYLAEVHIKKVYASAFEVEIKGKSLILIIGICLFLLQNA